jgi:hypothetical protein
MSAVVNLDPNSTYACAVQMDCLSTMHGGCVVIKYSLPGCWLSEDGSGLHWHPSAAQILSSSADA